MGDIKPTKDLREGAENLKYLIDEKVLGNETRDCGWFTKHQINKNELIISFNWKWGRMEDVITSGEI